MATIDIVPNPNNSDPQNIGTSTERWTSIHGDKVGTSRVQLDSLSSSPTDTSSLLYDLNGVLHYGNDPVGTGAGEPPIVAVRELTYSLVEGNTFTLPGKVFENDLKYVQFKVNGLQVPSSNLSFAVSFSTGPTQNSVLVYSDTNLYPLEAGDEISIWWLTSNGSSSGGGGSSSGQEWLLHTFAQGVDDTVTGQLATPSLIAEQTLPNETQAMLFINGVRVPNSELTFGSFYIDISGIGYSVDLNNDKAELFYIPDLSGTKNS